MKRHLLLFTFLALLIAILVGVNAISYTKIERKPDSEYFPNRSSYNFGATGTSAYYSLLSETQKKVTRWQQPPSALLNSANSKIRTFVLIGTPRRDITDEEASLILRWVSEGGRLVLIDRFPHSSLIEANILWKLVPITGTGRSYENVDPFNSASLIDKIAAAKPVQPTSLMKGVGAVQPSVLASTIKIEYSRKDKEDDYDQPPPPPLPPAAKTSRVLAQRSEFRIEKTPTPVPGVRSTPRSSATAPPMISTSKAVEKPAALPAPVIHLSNADKDILVDFPYGEGRIVFLSDPFIVSNSGIKMVDNSTLAINIVSVTDGTIAFDEFHQGFGSENTFFRYFAGTPVLGILGQALLLIFVLVWTRGRRFARPLPAPAKDRRSKLEYVSAMADLQQSTRAYDLAIENVYTQTKRQIVQLLGANNTMSKKQLAEALSERTGLDAKSLFKLMAKCEDIIHGEPTNARETMNLISELRALEDRLGFHRGKTSGVRNK